MINQRIDHIYWNNQDRAIKRDELCCLLADGESILLAPGDQRSDNIKHETRYDCQPLADLSSAKTYRQTAEQPPSLHF